ncbi:MAG: ABC transporter permease [Pseudomonadota bacterium]
MLSDVISLIFSGDTDLYRIIGLSLWVSLSATLIASLLGLPAGAALALYQFRGRKALIVVTSAFMALPPVVVGLAIYLLLSRSGPLGELGLLFTPTAMIIAQSVLVFPIITILAFQACEPLVREYRGLFDVMALRTSMQAKTVLWDARFALVTTVLAGFGRAIAEVGAVIVVGGNINGVTRVMTTTIALETSKGNLTLALALGIILIIIALSVNLLVHSIGTLGERHNAVRIA